MNKSGIQWSVIAAYYNTTQEKLRKERVNYEQQQFE